MKKVYVIVIVILSFHLKLFAHLPMGTDFLIWKGDTFNLYYNWLELRVDYDLLMMQIEEDSFDILACSRGYYAEWIVLNDSIFLNNIYPCFSNKTKIDLNSIFPDIGKNQKIFASWINEDLYVPQGDYIFAYEFFEKETVLNVKGGLLKNHETYNNRIIFFESFKRIEPYEYNRFFYEKINFKNLPNLTNKSITVSIKFYPNEQGTFECIDEEYTWLIESTLNESSLKNCDINNIFIQECIRIVKLIPGWDVVYMGGKIIAVNLIIVLSDDKKTFFVSSAYSR